MVEVDPELFGPGVGHLRPRELMLIDEAVGLPRGQGTSTGPHPVA
jgi:hypothetical protein